MYDGLNYLSVVVFLIAIAYGIFKHQAANKRIEWVMIFVFGIGLITAYGRLEMFIEATMQGGDRVSFEILTSGLRLVWLPLVFAFFTCLVLKSVSVYKDKKEIKL